jgi:hypothetical protein
MEVCENMEYRVSREKMLQRLPVAVLVTIARVISNTSLPLFVSFHSHINFPMLRTVVNKLNNYGGVRSSGILRSVGSYLKIGPIGSTETSVNH